MSYSFSACDDKLLRESLADRLSEAEEERLTQHLADCVACREELERLAAEPQEWQRIRGALSDNLFHSTGEAVSGETRQISLSARPEEIDSEAAADFAVEFLSASSRPGSLGRLGEIEILEMIGRGGMGVVLKGMLPEDHRLVAVKVLAPHLAMSGAGRKRFAREAQGAAAIVHPNVMPILMVQDSGKLPYLVMPYVAGESLQQRIDREGALPVVEILRIGLQVARGLAAAHAQGLIHRDVKPANILLEKGIDRVLLADFGLARAVDDASLTRTGIIAGTPQYMSPEQARGESIDPRSDQFSLGSVLYAMAAGRGPFRAETSYGILRRVTDAEPRPLREIHPDLPPWLAGLVQKLHSKNPADRYPDVSQVADLLERCLAHLQQPLLVPLPDGLPGMKSKFRRRLVAGGVVVGTVGLLSLAVAWYISPRGEDQIPTQQRQEQHLAATIEPAPTSQAPAEPIERTSRADLWDDGIEQGIDQLGVEVLRLEREVREAWKTPSTP